MISRALSARRLLVLLLLVMVALLPATAGAVPFGEDFVHHYKRHENSKTRG